MAKARAPHQHQEEPIRNFSKTLIDTQMNIYESEWELNAEDMGLHPTAETQWNFHKFTLHGGKQQGVDILTLNNGRMEFDIVLSRGMNILDASLDDIFFGWDSPVGGAACEAIHPAYVRLEENGGLGWLNGFNEWLVRCGMTHNGAPGVDTDGKLKTLHGGLANTPASFVQVSVGLEPPYFLSVQGVVFESSMFGPNLRLDTTMTTAPGANWLVIQDRITNMRSTPEECQMLYHINYGPPLLEKGSRLLTASDSISPRDPYATKRMREWDVLDAPKSGRPEECYFIRPRADRNGYAVAGLRNKAGDLAVSHIFPVEALPYLTVWKNEGALEDGYVTGIEPGTNHPNFVGFERQQGRIVKLGPGESWHSDMTIIGHVGREEVSELEKKIKAIQGGKKCEILLAPQPGLSPQATTK